MRGAADRTGDERSRAATLVRRRDKSANIHSVRSVNHRGGALTVFLVRRLRVGIHDMRHGNDNDNRLISRPRLGRK